MLFYRFISEHLSAYLDEHQHRAGEKDFKYAILFWDAAEKSIGIHFTNDESEKKNAFLIARSKEGYGGSISAKSFFRHYKIDPKTYHGRYEWTKRTEEGIAPICQKG